jgi:hypothetical protein
MTCKSREPQGPDSQTCGVSEKVPSDMEQMMQKMLAGCGPMMAEMTQKLGARENNDEPTANGEADQPPQNLTRRKAGCGCGPMMEHMLGECCKGGTSKAGEQD